MKVSKLIFLLSLFGTILGGTAAFGQETPQATPKEATEVTKQHNLQVLQELPFSNKTDFENAHKGFIATLPEVKISGAKGNTVWDLGRYEFLKQEAPPSVNPSLWRMAQLNMNNGLFKVTDRIYQIRGFDLSNMSIIEGDTGIIIIDPLLAAETAKAGLDLYYQNRPKKPVVAVIYTHSHVDHYAGVRGVISEADVKSGKVHIYAPDKFLQEAISENVFAGNAMSRRSLYMYGALLPPGPYGQVDGGLGKTASVGTVTLIPPTDIITKTGETKTIDGVQIVFQMAPGTEAPSEMMFYLPQFKAFCAAEDATHTLHNLLTLRGAQVRSATDWWKALNTSLNMFGDKIEVVFASHHWPTWGNAQVVDFLEKQRDLYKYINDQSLRLMNQGFTMTEIAEQMKLPQSLAQDWADRDYYGSLNHDSKAVYQRYLGWYDSNPANLYPWPPEELGKRYVEAIGGEDAVVRKAQAAFDQGDYRWAAELGKHAVFANPDNKAARDVEADALEQLGYQTEDPAWRNEFLEGAWELRNGLPKRVGTQTASPDTIRAMTVEMILDFMGMRIDGPKAEGKVITMNWILPDTHERFAVTLKNSALTYTENKQLPTADFTLTMPRSSMDSILLKESNVEKELASGAAKISGDQQKFKDLIGLLVPFDPLFNIVAP